MKTLYEVPKAAHLNARDRKYAEQVASWLNMLGDDDEVYGSTDASRASAKRDGDTNGVVRRRWVDYCNSHGAPLAAVSAGEGR